MIRKGMLALACALVLAGCQTGPTERDMKAFLDDYAAKVKPLETKANLAYWEASISGDGDKYREASEAEYELSRLHADPVAYEQVQQFLTVDISDPLLKRQLVLVRNEYAGHQGDTKLLKAIIDKQTEVEKRFNTFRATLDGSSMTDNELKQILKTEKRDMERRRKAWEATKQIGAQVAEQVIELARLRNKLARSLGFKNYFDMSMRLNEQDPEEMVALFDRLDDMIRDEYAKVKAEMDRIQSKKFGVPVNQLMPWHYEDPFFQEGVALDTVDLDHYYQGRNLVEIVRRFYESIGLDVSDILSRSSLYEQEGKMQHAFCTHIDRSGDVRVLCNVKDNAEWMDTLLHELGHAVYDKYLDPGLPYVLREPAHTFTTEAIAMMFGRQARNPRFLMTYCDVPEVEADRVASDLYRGMKFQQLTFSRWCQVMMRFEKALYENPDRGVDAFNALWWKLKERYQLLRKPEGRNNPDWAAKIHISSYPVYYHNYMLGELLASQLQAILAKRVIHADNIRQTPLAGKPQVGEYLRTHVFRPGARYSWNEMIRRATDSPLDPVYYSRQFIDRADGGADAMTDGDPGE